MVSLLENFFVIFFLIYPIDALYVGGSLQTANDWQFIAKFCFFNGNGTLNLKVDYPVAYDYINLDMYYDDKWNLVYPNKALNCTQKESMGYTVVQLNEFRQDYGCQTNGTSIICSVTLAVNPINSIPRYWFAVLSRCNPQNNILNGMVINYIFEFHSGGGIFLDQFSYDEVGIFETSIVLVIIYALLLALTSITARILAIKNLLHTTYKFFFIMIVFQTFSYIFTLSEYGQFATSGMPTNGCGLVGRILDAIANKIFLLILILIAKGYTVTRGKLRTITCIKIIVFFSLYIVAYTTAFLYSEILFDTGLVNYFYTSPGGLALLAIKLGLGWLWFCYGIFFTIKNYPEKRKFYIAFAIFYSIWFWASPIVILCTNYVIAQYLQEKIGFIVLSLINLIGHSFFISLTFPSRANINFPFHVRTTQVDFINDKEETENYPHHKENEATEKHFGPGNPDEITLQAMFVTQKRPKEKYQMEDD